MTDHISGSLSILPYQIFLLLGLGLVVWGEVLKGLDLVKVVEYVKIPSN